MKNFTAAAYSFMLFIVFQELATLLVISDTPPAFRGLWIPRTNSNQGYDDSIWEILHDAKDMGITDVFLQIDLYETVPQDLTEAITDANNVNIAVHAWINLFRIKKPNDVRTLRHPCRLLGNHCEHSGEHAWMDPMASEVQEYVTSAVLNLVKSNNISGIHIDDIYYPVGQDVVSRRQNDVTQDVDILYASYVKSGGTISLDEWERANLSTFIASMSHKLKSNKPGLKFTINTIGLYHQDDDDDVIDLSNSLVTSTSSSWPETQDYIGDFLSPPLLWLPGEDNDNDEVMPMIIDPSILSPSTRALYMGESQLRLLDPAWPVFFLNAEFEVRSRKKRSTMSDEIIFQLFTSVDQEEAIAFSDPYEKGEWVGDDDSRLFIIIHGYFSGSHKEWIKNLRTTLLNVTEGSWVIVVDWGTLADSPIYKKSKERIDIVAEKVKTMLNVVMSRTGIAQEQMHCIGHSLGAHTCGLVGKTYRFGRISGLDPAGPLFDKDDMSTRLAYTDAEFVDVIHSDVGFGELNFGMEEAIGDVDFYPNGGAWRQPGCWEPICSHRRAPKYYAESVLTDCFLATHKCTSESNLPDNCDEGPNGTHYTRMGYHSHLYNATGIYYLQTGSSSPYCSGKSTVEPPGLIIGGICALIVVLVVGCSWLAVKCRGHHKKRTQIAIWMRNRSMSVQL